MDTEGGGYFRQTSGHSPRQSFSLGVQEIHVHSVWLYCSSAHRNVCRAVLSASEVDRADRFAFEHLATAYEIAHAALRLLLARYLDEAPEHLEFTVARQGKPELKHFRELRFNIAHSGDLAVYAFASHCDVGIDVERVREVCELEAIASRYFCREEAEELRAIATPAERLHSFFRCWTRKEAYVKALGDGLHAPLDRFRVTFRGSQSARFVHIEEDVSEAKKWQLHHLDPAPSYTGAVAYRGSVRRIGRFDPVTVTRLIDL